MINDLKVFELLTTDATITSGIVYLSGKQDNNVDANF